MDLLIKKEKNKKIVFATSLILFCIFLPYWLSVSILFFAALSIAIWFYLPKATGKNEILLFKIVLVAFTLRFILIVGSNLFSIKIIQGDDLTYEQIGRYLAQQWLGTTLLSGKQDLGSLIYLGGVKNNYYFYLHAVVYFVLDFMPVVVRIITTFFGVLVGINIFILAKHFFNRRAAYLSSVFTLFMPSLILWQILNLKEAIVVFSVTYVYRKIIVDVKDKLKAWDAILIIIGLGLLFYTRNYAAFILGVIAFGYLFMKTRYKRSLKAMITIACLVVFAFVSSKLSMGLLGSNYFKMLNLDFLLTAVRESYTGGSEVFSNISLKSYKDLILFIPIGAFYFIFAPFPWHYSGSFVLWFASMENIIWYLMFIFFIVGFVHSFREKMLDVLSIIAFISAFVFIYSCIMFNIGVAFRYKCMLYPLFFIFSAGGMDQVSKLFDKKLKIK